MHQIQMCRALLLYLDICAWLHSSEMITKWRGNCTICGSSRIFQGEFHVRSPRVCDLTRSDRQWVSQVVVVSLSEPGVQGALARVLLQMIRRVLLYTMELWWAQLASIEYKWSQWLTSPVQSNGNAKRSPMARRFQHAFARFPPRYSQDDQFVFIFHDHFLFGGRGFSVHWFSKVPQVGVILGIHKGHREIRIKPQTSPTLPS